MKKLALIFWDTKVNRYSFNALLGALEKEEISEEISFYFLKEEAELISSISTLLEEFSKVVIAFSFFTLQILEIKKLVERLRHYFKIPKSKLVLIAGGPHPTGKIRSTLEMGFDLVLVREGEKSFIEILETLLKEEPWEKVKGVAFLKENQLIFTGNPNTVDLNYYPPFSFKYNRIGPIEITRGCPYRCSFCQTPRIFGNKVRHRLPETILKYVEILLRRGIKDFRFITPNAFSYGSCDGKTLNLLALEELLKSLKNLIKPQGGRLFFGSFPSEVRPEHVNEETVGLIKKYADNDNLVIGAQSGSERILELCQREHTVEDVYRAVKITVQAGLKPKIDFIFGLPGETKEDVELTIKVMKDLTKMGAIIHAHTFMPLPQTPFSSKKVGEISPQLLKTINTLLGKGLLYGDWKKQKLIFEKILTRLQNGL